MVRFRVSSLAISIVLIKEIKQHLKVLRFMVLASVRINTAKEHYPISLKNFFTTSC